MDFTNIKDVMEIGEYLSSFKKSELRTINDYLLKIRNLGVVNMFQSGDFLMMTKQYFLDFMRLESYKKDFDEDEINEIADLVDDVRNIMISAGIRKVESGGGNIEVRSVEGAIRLLIRSTVKYYMMGVLNNV
jgi:hypothetical protein